MSTQCVKVTISDGIAYVQLNRPEKMNAINYLMFSELDRTIKKFRKIEPFEWLFFQALGKL